MEFRILGPLEIRTGTGVTPLPRRRERALLAALLLRPNEVVSTDRLIEALWGESPPRTAVGSLQNAVWSLRKTLGDDVLRTQPPGYVLSVALDDVDATRFERMVRRASGLEAPERAELLAQALALWRGPALGDLADESFARLEANRLDELRLGAVEERIEADLDVGRDSELIPELESHIAAHPYRERARRQLMLALYRAGRQADALEAYNHARRALDELGIEPAAELQELQRRILRQDPDLLLAGRSGERPVEPRAAAGARKTVTVLACSLAGVEGADPEQLRPRLETWLVAARTAIGRHGGTLDQFVGTDVVAVFGVPTAHEDDALRAVRAAVDLRELLDVDGLAARSGVATGEALVGAGSAPVVGAVVERAKGLRDGAGDGQTIVSGSTLALVRDAVTTGNSTPDGVELLAAQGAHGRERRLDVPLVGRESQLATLREALARATSERRCVTVTVVGEAGLGKTRLARELGVTLAEGTVLTGRCVPYGEGTTYVPVVDVIREAAGAVTGDAIEALLGDGGAETARDLVSLSGAGDPVQRGEVFLAVRALLTAVAARAPVLLVLDDLHWAEAVVLDLVEYLGDRIEAPVLLVCLGRPELIEMRPDWAASPTITLLRLPPLTAEESRAALAGFADAALDAATQTAIVDRAGGNPLHLELLQAYAADDHAPDETPDTVQALLSQRLDQLSTDELDVLRVASVLGQSVTRAGVIALASERETVDAALHGLVRRALLHPEPAPAGDDGYVFHHALLRNVAYDGLTKETRATLHERAATWLDRDGEGLDEVVGFHLEQTHDYRQEVGHPPQALGALAVAASDRLARAAWREWRGGNVRTTIDLYGRTLRLTPLDAPTRAERELELALALTNAQRLSEASVWLDAALASAIRSGSRPLELRVRIEQERRKLDRDASSPAEVITLVDDALPILAEAGDHRGLGRAYLAREGAAFYLGRYEQAIGACEEAIAHYREISYTPGAAAMALASALLFGPTPAREATVRCEELHSEGDRTTQAAIDCSLAALHALRGDFVSADASLGRAVEQWDAIGLQISLTTTALERQMFIAKMRGAVDEAEAIGRERLAVYTETSQAAWEATVAVQLAWLLVDREELDEADALVERATENAHPHDVLVQSLISSLRGRLLARRGDHTTALASARVGVDALAETDGLIDLATAWTALAEVEFLAGRDADGLDSSTRAERFCADKEAPELWGRLSRLLERS